MQLNFKKILQYLIFVNCLALFILPELNNVHYYPSPSFWAEINFAWVSVIIFLLVCYSSPNLYFPRVIIPIIGFIIFLLIQPFFITIDFIGLSYISEIELALCILLAISFNTLIHEFTLKRIVTYIAISIVIGGIFQSLIGIIQYSGFYKSFGSLIFYDSRHPTTNIFGHLGQRNHYCHYLTWAIFSLIYLFLIDKLKKLPFILLICLFLFSITIAASRSVFIYFALAVIISFFFFLTQKKQEQKKLALTLFLLVSMSTLLLVLFEYFYPLINIFPHHKQIDSGLTRLAIANNTDGIAGRRAIEWAKSFMTFKQYPIFGYGWLQFASQSVNLASLFPHEHLNDGLFTNPHSLIFQLLAETGLIGTFIFLTGFIYTIYHIIKNNSIETTIIVCMIATTIAHSLLEYPLFYFFFLGSFIIFLSIDKSIIILPKKPFIIIMTIPLVILISLIIKSSIMFDKLVEYGDVPTEQEKFIQQGKTLESIAQNDKLFAYYALYTLDDYIIINNPNTNALFEPELQLKLMDKLSNFHPWPSTLIKQAMLNWNLHNEEKAKRLTQIAIIAYPNYKKSILKQLKGKKYYQLEEIVKSNK